MKLLTTIKNMCTPAQLYFGISLLAFLLILIQNYGSCESYHLGQYHCETDYGMYFFLAKIAYILLWTYVLHIICKSGFQVVSWVLVLLPFLSMFALLGMAMYNQNIINEPFTLDEEIADYLVDTMDEKNDEDEEYMMDDDMLEYTSD
jgi:hypothetical protein